MSLILIRRVDLFTVFDNIHICKLLFTNMSTSRKAYVLGIFTEYSEENL
jgi:hypothetical protein